MKAVEILVSSGARVDAQPLTVSSVVTTTNSQVVPGNTALICAAREGHHAVVEFLLSLGKDSI